VNTPQQYKAGDSWNFVWTDIDRRIVFERVHEHSDGEISADVWVKTAEERAETGKIGHVYWGRIPNLASSRSKVEWVNAVKARSPLSNGHDWGNLLEYATVKLAEAIAEPEPVVDLSEVMVPDCRDYLVPWLLPKGEPTHLFANSEGGKSLFAAFLAVSLSTGIELPNGLKPCRVGSVLYIDYETHKAEMGRRVQWIARGLGVKCPKVYYLRPYRPFALEIGAIRKRASEVRADLVVLDSVTFCTERKLVDVDSAAEVYAALDSLKTTAMTIGHVSKDVAGKSGQGSAFGSMAWRAKARNSWELKSIEAENGDKLISLFHDKDNNGAKFKGAMGFRIHFDDVKKAMSIKGLNVEDEPELAMHGSQRMQIRAALKREGCLTLKEIEEETGIAAKTVGVVIKRMPEAVEVTVGGRGRGNAAKWGLAAYPQTPIAPPEPEEIPF
jgi:hypothetical protein